jgi:hypothetical protein
MVVSRDRYKCSGMRNDTKHVVTRRDGFTLHVKSPVVELDVDDLDCCYKCITLLIRLLMRRKRTESLRRRHSI